MLENFDDGARGGYLPHVTTADTSGVRAHIGAGATAGLVPRVGIGDY